jgi:S-adenosylmethionine hydrolase
MESSSLARIDDDRCQNLRWKGMYVATVVDPNVGHSNDGLFWCHRTSHCVGPDNKLVDDYECNETRPCFKAL